MNGAGCGGLELLTNSESKGALILMPQTDPAFRIGLPFAAYRCTGSLFDSNSLPKETPMARATQSVDEIIKEALGGVMSRIAPVIAKAFAEAAAAGLEKHLTVKSPARRAKATAPRRSRAVELTRWVADRSARRVPNFVIELTTGLDTKKRIVAKYGENAVFEKGKPLPKPKADSVKAAPDGKKASPKEALKEAARVVSAK